MGMEINDKLPTDKEKLKVEGVSLILQRKFFNLIDHECECCNILVIKERSHSLGFSTDNVESRLVWSCQRET